MKLTLLTESLTVTAGLVTPLESVAMTIRSPAWMPVPDGMVIVAGELAALPVMLAELTRVTTAQPG